MPSLSRLTLPTRPLATVGRSPHSGRFPRRLGRFRVALQMPRLHPALVRTADVERRFAGREDDLVARRARFGRHDSVFAICAVVKRRGGAWFWSVRNRLCRCYKSAPVDQLVGHGSPLPPFDVQAPLLSLPGIFQTTLDRIPADVPYLFAAPQLVDAWREKLKGVAGFRVGIGWQGNPAFREDRERSFTLAWFAPLAQIPGVRLIRLQKGAGSEQLAAPVGWAVPTRNCGVTPPAHRGKWWA